MSTETDYKALAGVDNVNHPAHYKLPGGGAESLKKARWYLDRLIGMQELKEMGLRDV